MLTVFSNSSSPSLLPSVSEIIDCHEASFTISLLNLIQGIDEAPEVAAAIANGLPWQYSSTVMEICETTDWDYGELWLPSEHSTVLELSPVWHIAPDTVDWVSLEQFRLCSEGLVVSPGEGLPGRVWLSQQPEWIVDATAESESYELRNQLARAFNIGAGVGVPMITNNQVQAVLVFFKVAP
jgi:hypothetical protein